LREHTDKLYNGHGPGDLSRRNPSRLLSPFGDTLDTGHFSQLSLHECPSFLLPTPSSATDKLIPVNKDGDRLETYSPQPSEEAWNMYRKRASRHKVCNRYHLSGKCHDEDCEFDHSKLPPQVLEVLGFILKQIPCPRGSACRLAKCYSGHICRKDGCRGRTGCRFKPNKHVPYIDINVADWVSPIDVIVEGEDEESDEFQEDLLLDSPQADSSTEDGGVESWSHHDEQQRTTIF
jgi:hypothetical protein